VNRPMPPRYVHTNLIAHDWQRLSRFYIDVFGCEPVPPTRDLSGDWLARSTAVAGARLRGQHLRLPGHGADGPTLEIFQYDEVVPDAPPAANRAGLGHLAFAVGDVAATLDAVVAAGGARHAEIASTEVPGVGRLTVTYVQDPEGNLIELQTWT